MTEEQSPIRHAPWERTRERLARWWQRDDFIVSITAPRDGAYPPDQAFWLAGGIDTQGFLAEPTDLETTWTDPQRRVAIAQRMMQHTYYAGDAFPHFDTNLGPGSLALLLGSQAHFMEDTVWYEPCIDDLADYPPLRFDPAHPWFIKHKTLVQAGVAASQGRYPVTMPDLIENLDILTSLRGGQPLLLDLVERPEQVRQRVAEINQVYFEVFDALYPLISDPWGGNAFCAFRIWGPGKTAKIQCDAAAMISPRMFGDFVVPALTEQSERLDYTMFHLDGTQAMVQLDQLLAIEELDAIEWTPQAGKPGGGDPVWFDMYRKILDAGKCVQAIQVNPDEVLPLLDALGTKGVFIMLDAPDEQTARDLEQAVEAYRR